MRGVLLSLLDAGVFLRLRILAFTAAVGIAACAPVAAQTFGLSVSTATNAVSINSSVGFSISITNLTAFQLQNVFVTNSVSGTAPVQIIGATATQGFITTNSTVVAFDLGPIIAGGIAQMTVTVRPTTLGIISNGVVVAASVGPNTSSTNVVVQVAPPVADLAVSLTAPAAPVLLNDWITYGVSVTNLGTNVVSNVMLTNTGFNSMSLLGISPTNQSFTLTNGLLLLNVGTLGSQGGRHFEFTVQPTNAGALSLSASVSAAGFTESNVTNNMAGVNITVEPLATGDLIATNAASMTYNPQTGLMQQVVRLANVGTNSVASARVIVSGLTNRLYNAAGTNNGNPFVVHSAPLDPGQGADLLMEYFIPTRTAILVPNASYTAVGTTAVNLTVTNLPAPNITMITNLVSGGVMIEFESVPGRSYTVLYSDNSSFTNALAAQPAVVAPADRVQWIDNGPPKTASHPLNSSSRFYRVLLNP